MRAVLLTGHGGLDKLVYREDVPDPTPGPGQVLIQVAACGLNNTDINTRTAWYSDTVNDGITAEGGEHGYASADASSGSWSRHHLSFPRIQGADVVGTITAVGKGVDPARIGQRVLVDPWLRDWSDPLNRERCGYFGSECDGGYAEYTVVDNRNAVAINTPLTDAELATFPCSYSTAEYLISRPAPEAGETVLITGASGGVGSAAIQLCKRRGARVVAVAGSAKLDTIKALGADGVVSRESTTLADDVQDAAGGPVDVVLDVVGGKQFPILLECLRPAGRYASSGAIAGPRVDLDLRQLIYKDLAFFGATVMPPGIFQDLVGYIQRAEVQPVLAAIFPLTHLVEAQRAFMSKTHVGNIVVQPSTTPP